MTCPPKAEAQARLTRLLAARDRLVDGEAETSVKYGEWAATYSAGSVDSMAAMQSEIDRMRRCLGIGGRRSMKVGFR